MVPKSSQENQEDVEGDGVNYPARDVREMAQGGKVRQGEVAKSRRRGPGVCDVCYGVCCGAARELVENLSKMGAIGITSKVISGLN